MRKLALPALAALGLSAPLMAKDSLGVFSTWAAFRDPSVPRCYAIAEAEPSTLSRDFQPYGTIASWPARRIRNQVHLRLSRELRANTRVTLRVGRISFRLTPSKADAWARDAAMDNAILDAVRKADSMTVYATDARGRRFSNTYRLAGAATAIDAATLACTRR